MPYVGDNEGYYEGELKRLRNRLLDIESRIDSIQSRRALVGSAAIMGQIFDGGNIPQSAGCYFLIHPIRSYATISEQNDPSPQFSDQVVPVLVLGPDVPVAGDLLIARLIQQGGRWVAEYRFPAMLCVIITTCGNNDLTVQGVMVTAKNSKGIQIGFCTALPQVKDLTLVSGGSYYADGKNYPLIFTGGIAAGGTLPTGTFDVVGGAVTNVKLTSGGTSLVGTPTVSLPASAGSGSGAQITASVGLLCCLPIRKKDTYSIHVSRSSTPFAADVTQAILTPGRQFVAADLQNFAKITVVVYTPFCQSLCGFITAVKVTGPNGYTRTLVNPCTFIFDNLPYAGTYTFAFTNVGATQPIPNQSVTVNLCDSLTLNVPVYGILVSGVVTVLGCGTTGAPGIPVRVTNFGDAPTFEFLGTTNGNGQLTVTGMLSNCFYNFEATYNGNCAGFSSPDPIVGGSPGAQTLRLKLDPAYGCVPSRVATLPPKLTLSGPGGTCTLYLDVDRQGYGGALPVSAHLTPCQPNAWDADNALGSTYLGVNYGVVPRPDGSNGAFLDFSFGVCGIGGPGNPLGLVAMMAWTEAQALAGSGPGINLAVTVPASSGSAVFCPHMSTVVASEADVRRPIAQSPAQGDLLSQLVGTWMITEFSG